MGATPRDKQGSGQTPRVTGTGTGAGRPGDTPDPCIPESVTQPVHTRQMPVAVFFLLYNLAGCTTPTTRSTPLFGTDDSHEGPRRPTAPTKADEEGKGPKRRSGVVWAISKLFSLFPLFFHTNSIVLDLSTF